jgi:hypothetical protein
MQSAIRFVSLTLFLFALSCAARADTTICTEIAAVPYFVSAPGIYCLKTSLSTAGGPNAIAIGVDDVVIDLNGNILDGSPAGPGTNNIGVLGYNRKHVIVRNGTIRGFRDGITLSGSSSSSSEGYVVERVRLEHNVWHGAFVQGKGSIVRNNTVVGTGNGTGSPGSTGNPRGLWVNGDFSHVTDNEVLDTMESSGGTAHGIIVPRATGVVVERNVVSNAAFGPTSSFGIAMGGSLNTAVGNRVANMRFGINFNGTGIYMDNTVGGATTPYTGGTAAGATNFSF